MSQLLTTNKMSTRIFEREDNVYKRKMILEIVTMYMDECRKAMLKGERVQLSGVGTLIPKIRVRKTFSLPICNKPEGNPPYTELKLGRNYSNKEEMDIQLRKNIREGIYGLEAVPFTPQQMRMLKEIGYIPEDAEVSPAVYGTCQDGAEGE